MPKRPSLAALAEASRHRSAEADDIQAAQPLDHHEFSHLMAPLAPFECAPRIAVAVSGGADSMALALLASDWVAAHNGSLIALTVDHGLRSESAAEAGQVGRWLAGRGIEHRILRWIGRKPTTRIQE